MEESATAVEFGAVDCKKEQNSCDRNPSGSQSVFIGDHLTSNFPSSSSQTLWNEGCAIGA